MTWAIGVAAVFLATVFAVLLVILVWSRRAEIRAVLRERRGESRIPTGIPIELSNLDESFAETVTTENVSRHGARVLTTTCWRPHYRVLVTLPRAVQRSHAQIAYCELLPGNWFAVGLKFSSAFNECRFDPECSDHPSRK